MDEESGAIQHTAQTESLNNAPVVHDDESMADKTKVKHADRWVGDVVIGTTGTSLCIRPSEANKAMGLMKGETVRIVIWRAPAKNKLPVFPDEPEEK